MLVYDMEQDGPLADSEPVILLEKMGVSDSKSVRLNEQSKTFTAAALRNLVLRRLDVVNLTSSYIEVYRSHLVQRGIFVSSLFVLIGSRGTWRSCAAVVVACRLLMRTHYDCAEHCH